MYKRQEVCLEQKEHCHLFWKSNRLETGWPFITNTNLALRKVTQSIKMVPSGIKIGKEQLNILAYADDTALNGKNEIEMRKSFVEMEDIPRKFGLDKPKKRQNLWEWKGKRSLKKNKIGHLKIKNYKFERVENFKYLGVILN